MVRGLGELRSIYCFCFPWLLNVRPLEQLLWKARHHLLFRHVLLPLSYWLGRDTELVAASHHSLSPRHWYGVRSFDRSYLLRRDRSGFRPWWPRDVLANVDRIRSLPRDLCQPCCERHRHDFLETPIRIGIHSSCSTLGRRLLLPRITSMVYQEIKYMNAFLSLKRLRNTEL
jgi:hypothetical protein